MLNRRTDLGQRDSLSRSSRRAVVQIVRSSSSGSGATVTKAQIIALLAWELKVASFTLVAGDRINATAIATAIDVTLPAVIAAKDEFVIHNASTSTKVVQLLPNGHSIVGAGGTVTSSDTLVLAPGDTAHLVAVTSAIVEVV